jgi:uncharacterized LabA/DUF88 family protein
MSARTKTAIFIDAYNFQKLSYDAFGVRVDFAKLARHLAGDNFLVRTYYYTGEFNDESIEQFVRLSSSSGNPEQQRAMMQKRRSSQNRFLRFLSRNGFKVVSKTARVYRDFDSEEVRVKADLDLELAIDMLTLSDHLDEAILVSGDGDFVPLVHAVAAKGVRVVVVSSQSVQAMSRGYRASDLLLDAADAFVAFESLIEYIARDDTEAEAVLE